MRGPKSEVGRRGILLGRRNRAAIRMKKTGTLVASKRSGRPDVVLPEMNATLIQQPETAHTNKQLDLSHAPLCLSQLLQ